MPPTSTAPAWPLTVTASGSRSQEKTAISRRKAAHYVLAFIGASAQCPCASEEPDQTKKASHSPLPFRPDGCIANKNFPCWTALMSEAHPGGPSWPVDQCWCKWDSMENMLAEWVGGVNNHKMKSSDPMDKVHWYGIVKVRLLHASIHEFVSFIGGEFVKGLDSERRPMLAPGTAAAALQGLYGGCNDTFGDIPLSLGKFMIKRGAGIDHDVWMSVLELLCAARGNPRAVDPSAPAPYQRLWPALIVDYLTECNGMAGTTTEDGNPRLRLVPPKLSTLCARHLATHQQAHKRNPRFTSTLTSKEVTQIAVAGCGSFYMEPGVSGDSPSARQLGMSLYSARKRTHFKHWPQRVFYYCGDYLSIIQHVRLRVIEVGCVIWEAAMCMCRLIEYLESETPGFWRGLDVVELGAGTGMAGILAAKLGANVTLTDKAELLNLMRINSEENGVLSYGPMTSVAATPRGATPRRRRRGDTSRGGIRSIQELPWGEGREDAVMPCAMVLVSDCIYDEAWFKALYSSLDVLAASGATVYMTYMLRYRDQDTLFFDICQPSLNWEYVAVPGIEVAPGDDSQLFVVRFWRRAPGEAIIRAGKELDSV